MKQLKLFGNKGLNLVAPTTTLLPARLAIYQPSRRPRELRSHKLVTQWGCVTIEKARLGQCHADVMEAIFTCAEQRRDTRDGVDLLIDPAKVLRLSGQDSKHLKELIIDLQTAVISIETKEGNVDVQGQILQNIFKSKANFKPNPLDWNNPRPMWIVKVGVVYTRLLMDDLPLNYNPQPISECKGGIAQAIIRLLLTQRNAPNGGGWFVDGLLNIIFGGHLRTAQEFATARQSLKKDETTLNKLGFELSGKGKMMKILCAKTLDLPSQ